MALSDIEINTLGLIYDAMKVVDAARTDDDQPKEVRLQLGKIYRQLDSVRALLIKKHVEAYLATLEERSAELDSVTAGIKQDIARIKKLADAINKAADAIKFIINTAKGAMSSGIL